MSNRCWLKHTIFSRNKNPLCEISAETSTGGHQGLQYNSQADEEQGSREAEAFPGEQHVAEKHTFLSS